MPASRNHCFGEQRNPDQRRPCSLSPQGQARLSLPLFRESHSQQRIVAHVAPVRLVLRGTLPTLMKAAGPTSSASLNDDMVFDGCAHADGKIELPPSLIDRLRAKLP
jgi:hypothetical protein